MASQFNVGGVGIRLHDINLRYRSKHLAKQHQAVYMFAAVLIPIINYDAGNELFRSDSSEIFSDLPGKSVAREIVDNDTDADLRRIFQTQHTLV